MLLGTHLGFILGGFWVGFGCQDGPKILKKSILDLSNNYKQKYIVLDAQKIDFGRILASKMGAQEGPQKLVLEVYFGLGRVLGPRWPQDPSRDLPRLIFLILDFILIDFGTKNL